MRTVGRNIHAQRGRPKGTQVSRRSLGQDKRKTVKRRSQVELTQLSTAHRGPGSR